jgi:hypothetical protein
MVMDHAALIVDVDASVIMLRTSLILVMSMDVIESAGCGEVICNVVLGLDIMPKVCCEQRHHCSNLGNQKETQQPGRKPSQSA